jgi:hypothetical protein
MLRKLFCCINKDHEDHNVEEPIPYGEDENFIEIKKYIPNKVRYMIIEYDKDKHSDKECSICFDEYNTEIALLPCLHYFHKECIDSWWVKSNQYECPICRMQT